MKKTIAFVFALMLSASLFAQQTAKKPAPPVEKTTHFLAYDLDKADYIPYDNPKEIRLFVIGPSGIEPAVVIAESDAGTDVLLGSVTIATKMLDKGTPNDPLATPPPPAEDLKTTER